MAAAWNGCCSSDEAMCYRSIENYFAVRLGRLCGEGVLLRRSAIMIAYSPIISFPSLTADANTAYCIRAIEVVIDHNQQLSQVLAMAKWTCAWPRATKAPQLACKTFTNFARGSTSLERFKDRRELEQASLLHRQVRSPTRSLVGWGVLRLR